MVVVVIFIFIVVIIIAVFHRSNGDFRSQGIRRTEDWNFSVEVLHGEAMGGEHLGKAIERAIFTAA